MKTLKNTMLVLAFLLFGSNAQAQFFKKLAKKAGQAAEETVIKKAEQKAAEKASKSFDKVFNMDIGGASSVDPASLPETYEFKWRYTLQMTAKQGDFKIHYFLNENDRSFASKPEMERNPAGNTLMVMDPSLKVMTMFIESNGEKFGQILDLPDTISNMAENTASDMEGYTMIEIGQKEILGYTCQGFKMESDEHSIISYVALNAPVTFGQMSQGGSQALPKGFDEKWLKYAENSILMEMQFTHKKKKKQNMTMTCIALEEESVTIKVSDYEFMSMNPQKK